MSAPKTGATLRSKSRESGRRFSWAFRAGAPSPLTCLPLALPLFGTRSLSRNTTKERSSLPGGGRADSFHLHSLGTDNFTYIIQVYKMPNMSSHGIMNITRLWIVSHNYFYNVIFNFVITPPAICAALWKSAPGSLTINNVTTCQSDLIIKCPEE